MTDHLTTPIEDLEIAAVVKGYARKGSIYIIHQGGNNFCYQLGDAIVSRACIVRKLECAI